MDPVCPEPCTLNLGKTSRALFLTYMFCAGMSPEQHLPRALLQDHLGGHGHQADGCDLRLVTHIALDSFWLGRACQALEGEQKKDET